MRNTLLALGGTIIVAALGITAVSPIPVTASNAQADSFNAKPGAWEMTFTTTTTGSLVPADVLAKMPPEQRAKFEQAMKARSAKPTTHVSKECLSQEDLDQNRMIKDDGDDEGSHCTTRVASKSPSKLVFEKSCTSPRPSTAQAIFEAKNPEVVTGSIDITRPGSGKVHVEIKGRWLGANCAAFNAHD